MTIPPDTRGLSPAVFLFACTLAMVGEATAKDARGYIWPVACTLLLLYWLGRAITRPKSVAIHPLLTLGFIAVMVAWVFSLSSSLPISGVEPQLAKNILLNNRDMFLTAFVFLGMMAVGADLYNLDRFFRVIVYSGVFYAVTVFFMGGRVETTGEVGRYTGVFVDIGPASTFLLFCLLLTIALLRNRSFVLPVLICIPIFALGLIPTNSKTALVAVGLLMVLGPLLEGRWRISLVLVCTLPLLVFALLPVLPGYLVSSIKQVFVSLFISPDISVRGSAATLVPRAEQFKNTLELWTHYPFFGCGLGRHSAVLPMVTHMSYVTILAETGLFGFIGWVLMTIGVFWTGIRNIIRTSSTDPAIRNILTSLLLGLILCLVVMLTQPWRGQENRLYWVIAGLIAGIDVANRRRTLNGE